MTKLEQTLTNKLADLLEVDSGQIGLHVTFADLGVDSIVGLRFMRTIQELVGGDVELECIFDYPTISELSRYLEEEFEGLDECAA